MGYILRVEFQKDREPTSQNPTSRTDSRHNLEERPEAASRNLFVGNLEANITREEIQAVFEKFGEVEDIDIKRPSTRAQPQSATADLAAFAFVKFAAVEAAMEAKKTMDREMINGRPCRVGYGRGAPTNHLWVGSLHSSVTDGEIWKEFEKFGRVRDINIIRSSNCAFVDFERVEDATKALNDLKGKSIGADANGWKLKVDFADQKSQQIRGLRPGGPTGSSGRFGEGSSSSSSSSSYGGSKYRDRSPQRDRDRQGRRDYGDRDKEHYGYDKDRRDTRDRGDRDFRDRDRSDRDRDSRGADFSRDSSYDSFGRDYNNNRGDQFGRDFESSSTYDRSSTRADYGYDRSSTFDDTKRSDRDSYDRGGRDRTTTSQTSSSTGRGGWSANPRSFETEAADRSFDRERDDRRGSVLDDDRSRRGGDRDDPRLAASTRRRSKSPEVAKPFEDFDKRDKGRDDKRTDSRDKGTSRGDYDRGDYSRSYSKDQPTPRGRESSTPGSSGTLSSSSLTLPPPPSNLSGSNGLYGSDRDFNRSFSGSGSTGRDYGQDYDRNNRDKPRDHRSSPPRRDDRDKDRGWDDKYYTQGDRSRSQGSQEGYSSSSSNNPPLPPSTPSSMSIPPPPSSGLSYSSPMSTQSLVRSRSGSEQVLDHSMGGDDHPSKRARVTSSGSSAPLPPFYDSSPILDARAKFLQRLAPGWAGSLSLKNIALKVQLQFMRGNLRLSDSVFPTQGSTLTTSQRMRLEPPQLEALGVRMRSENDYALLFVLPATDVPDPVGHMDMFNRNFVPYLVEKQAAGIIRLNTGIIYLFPPCPFAFQLIRNAAPDVIKTEAELRDYLLAIVFRNV